MVHRPEANIAVPQSIGCNCDSAIMDTHSLPPKQTGPSIEAFSRLLQSSLKGQLLAVVRSTQESHLSCMGEGSGPGSLTLASSSTERKDCQFIVRDRKLLDENVIDL